MKLNDYKVKSMFKHLTTSIGVLFMKKFTISVVIFVAALISISYGRTWTDNKGHTITADYVSLVKLDEPKVKLLTPSGKNLLVPVRNLSKEDQEYIQIMQIGAAVESITYANFARAILNLSVTGRITVPTVKQLK